MNESQLSKTKIPEETKPEITVIELFVMRMRAHEHENHPWYEYETTTGPRKTWVDEDVPPPGEGWERNIHRGNDGFERFDHHEESYWMRSLV